MTILIPKAPTMKYWTDQITSDVDESQMTTESISEFIIEEDFTKNVTAMPKLQQIKINGK
jgi:hypothetical protein